MIRVLRLDQGIKLLREATELLCSAASGNNRPLKLEVVVTGQQNQLMKCLGAKEQLNK